MSMRCRPSCRAVPWVRPYPPDPLPPHPSPPALAWPIATAPTTRATPSPPAAPLCWRRGEHPCSTTASCTIRPGIRKTLSRLDIGRRTLPRSPTRTTATPSCVTATQVPSRFISQATSLTCRPKESFIVTLLYIHLPFPCFFFFTIISRRITVSAISFTSSKKQSKRNKTKTEQLGRRKTLQN